VRDLCSAAGAPQGSFRDHFRSKEAFAHEVLDRYFPHVKTAVSDALNDKSLTPRQRLKRYLDIISGTLERDKRRRGSLIGDFSLEATSHSKLLCRRLEAIGRAASPARPWRSRRLRLITTFLRRCWAGRRSSGPRKWDVLDQTTGQSCGRAVVDEVSENHSPLSGGAVSLVRGYPLPDVERIMPRATVTFGRISLCT